LDFTKRFQILYHGANVLFKSTDGGKTWSAIQRRFDAVNDKTSRSGPGGDSPGTILGVEIYGTIFL